MPGNYYLHNKESSYIIKGELLREEEITYNTNRSMKDSVLRLLLDDEEILLQVFNALEGTTYKEKESVHINTLKGPIFSRRKNDLSFSVGPWYLSLIEHQSSLCPNIPLRMFIYLGRIYEQILDMTKTYRVSLYQIPLPRLYMLYNGTEEFPRETLLRLSDAFRQAAGLSAERMPSADLVVRAININTDKHHPLLQKCPVLKEYSQFIERIRKKLSEGRNRDLAVKEAIRECIEEHILHDFLMRHGREVFNMMFDEITYEDIMRIRIEEAEELATKRGMEWGIQKGIQEGIQEGIQQGVPQGIRQASERIALKMKEKDLPLSEISECTGLSEAAIKAL